MQPTLPRLVLPEKAFKIDFQPAATEVQSQCFSADSERTLAVQFAQAGLGHQRVYVGDSSSLGQNFARAAALAVDRDHS